MSIALRLNDELVHEAEAEALIHKRTAPRQIEYWAQIGKSVARNATASELLALMQGFARVQVNHNPLLDFFEKKIATLDTESVKIDIRRFIKDKNTLDIWSRDYFLELSRMMKVCKKH